MSDKKKTTEVAVRPEREFPRVENIEPLFDTDRFEQMQRSAQALMSSSILPADIRGESPAQCFSNLMVASNIAQQFGMSLLAVVQTMSMVHGKIVFEGKAIAAMLTGRGIRLHYHYTGERGTPGYRIYVWDQDFATLTDAQLDELKPGHYPRGARMIDGSVADWQTFDKGGKPLKQWVGTAQRNQLAYRGAREWARLYEPGTMLGVYGDDEIDRFEDDRRMRNITPQRPAPAISASFADEEERPAKDVSADIIEAEPDPAPDDEPAAETGGETSDEKQGGVPPDTGEELDLTGGEVVEDSPFDPVDEDEDEADQESEAGDPPFDPDEDDEPASSESGDEEGDEDPAITQEELDALADAKTWVEARDACLKVLKGELFMRSSFEAQEEARKAAYGVLAVRADAPRVDEDVVLFRLWITIVDDIDELEDAWSAIQQTDGFTKQKPSGQGQLKNAVELAYERFTPGGE